MIRLTQRRNGATFQVAPAAILTAGVYANAEKTNYVSYTDDGGDGVEIVEQPADVARLLAAWELRHHASELRGTLPISVGMDVKDGVPFISFHCCSLTKALKDKAEAQAAAARKTRWPSLLRTLVG